MRFILLWIIKHMALALAWSSIGTYQHIHSFAKGGYNKKIDFLCSKIKVNKFEIHCLLLVLKNWAITISAAFHPMGRELSPIAKRTTYVGRKGEQHIEDEIQIQMVFQKHVSSEITKRCCRAIPMRKLLTKSLP